MRLLFQIGGGILGIFLAQKFIPGVKLDLLPESELFGFKITAFWQILIITGGALGLINFFVKPIAKKIALPLRIITLGLFSLVINMLAVWVLDILFLELKIEGLTPLFWTTAIVWAVDLVLGNYIPKGNFIKKDK